VKRGDSLSNRINEKVQEDFRDLDIEYQLIGYIIRKNPSFCCLMLKHWLSDEILQDIYSIVSETRTILTIEMLKRDMKSHDLIEDEEMLDTCLEDLYGVDLTSFDEKSARHLISQVLDLFESRRILESVGGIIAKMGSFDLKNTKRKLKDLARPANLIDNENSGYYLEDYLQRVDIIAHKEDISAKSDSGGVGIATGVYKFDRACGGIMPEEFGVIAGKTGVGKTLALGCFGVTAWEAGYNVMLASGEMDKASLGFRIDANLAGIPAMKFRTAELTEEDRDRWDTTIKKYEAVQHGNFLYIATFHRSFSTDDIENEIIKVQDDNGMKLDWLGIDYLNIMDPVHGSKGTSKGWEAQSDVVGDVRALTADYSLVTWTGGQVTDEAYNKDLYDLSDLKYSRAISETAPVVIALIRTDEDLLANRMRLQVMKMRNATLPKRPIILSPNMPMMRLHQQIIGKRTLAGMGTKEVKTKRRTLHQMPKGGMKK